MTENEFERLNRTAPAPVPTIGPTPAGDRTLLLGWSAGSWAGDLPNLTWHAYQRDDVLHLVVYARPPSGDPKDLAVRAIDASDFRIGHEVACGDVALHMSGERLPCQSLVPWKRLYPEACDMAFCQDLVSKGISLPFTRYDPERDLSRTFLAFVADEMVPEASEAPTP